MRKQLEKVIRETLGIESDLELLPSILAIKLDRLIQDKIDASFEEGRQYQKDLQEELRDEDELS